jgi:sugar lactone lactonase YvrE
MKPMKTQSPVLRFFLALMALGALTGCEEIEGKEREQLAYSCWQDSAAVEFAELGGVITDEAGNLYVVARSCVRKITPEGEVGILAGSKLGFADGKGSKAQFSGAYGIAIDGAGNFYVADKENHRIRKVTKEGVVSTVAGSGTEGFADGKSSAARFNRPHSIAVDAAGNLYVTDSWNHRIRKITPEGVVSTFAGSGETGSDGGGFADGPGSAAVFDQPCGIAIDGAGNLYVADSKNHGIRKITPEGVVSTFAGSGEEGFAEGKGSKALFGYPEGITIDGAGNLYVADTKNHSIRKITPKGEVSTLAGGGPFAGVKLKEWFDDGVGSAAEFYYPHGIAIDRGGNLYVADFGSARIRKVTMQGEVSTLVNSAGGAARFTAVQRTAPTVVSTFAGGKEGFADGMGSAAKFNRPEGITIDGAGNLYVADRWNERIRKVTSKGNVSTLAGSGEYGDADGLGKAAEFGSPSGIAIDGAGNLYVADMRSHRIRKVTPKGEVSTFAGTEWGFADGSGNDVEFNEPCDIAIDRAGNLYVTDSWNHRIRKITPEGVVSTFAGSGETGSDGGGFADGPGSAAVFDQPCGIAIDAADNLYVTSGNRVRKITPEGVVSTFAGSGEFGYRDGRGSGAQFYEPLGIAIDRAGNLYVADTKNHRIRKIAPDGEVSTFAGPSGLGDGGFADGEGKDARFLYPKGIAIDAKGNLYVTANDRIRKIVFEKP